MHENKYEEILNFPVGEAKYPPDASQRKVIKSINNTVVSAGAGSGKTEVLATRFAYLLMTDPDLHVRNILAITFTKKAAAEIYARVFKKLNDFKNTLSHEEYNGKYIGENKPVDLAQRALDEFSDARIQTLDSYSNDVVKLAVARYGIKPDYNVGEPSSDINFMARNFVLKHLENPEFEDAYKVYSKVGNLEEFAKNYFAEPVLKYTSIATESGWFSKNLEVQAKEIVEAWDELFAGDDSEDDTENLSPAKRHFLISNFYDQHKNEKHKNYGTLESSPYFASCLAAINVGDEVCFSNLSISENELANLDSLLEKLEPFMNWINSISKISGEGYKNDMRAILKPLKYDKDDIFNLYGRLTSCYSFIKNYNATSQMYRLMDLFLDEVNSQKKRDGILSFKDISELALRVLYEQKDIREQQQSLIKKIMIDEFQDNNEKNKELLDLLAGDSKEKLFFVGDEKQSIYKFRGADVSVFNGLKNSLEGKGNEQVLYNMNNNYRSDPELLKAFNELFSGNEGKSPHDSSATDVPSLFYFDDATKIPEYEATYLKNNYATKPEKCTLEELANPDFIPNDIVAPINLAEKDENEKFKNIKIHACILHTGENVLPEDSENKEKKNHENFADNKKEGIILNESETIAYFIAKKIKELGKPYSQYAILDKTRTHRTDLQKFLAMENIPFSVDVQKNIFSDGIVNDFYNFLRICIYPNDTNAFTAFLTSPFACMSQIGAQNVMSVIFDKNAKETDEDGNKIIKNFEAFSDEFNTDDFSLTDTDKTKYENAKEFYKSERLKILSSSITKTVERLWYGTGYFYETKLNSNTKIYGEQFDLLYQIAIQAENQGKNIEWFVDQLAITKEIEKNSYTTDEDTELETSDVHYPLEKQDAVTIMTIHQSKGLEFDKVFVTGFFNTPKSDSEPYAFFEDNTGVSIKAHNGNQNYFYIRNIEDSKNKSDAEEKRLIYVAITRAKHEVFLMGHAKNTKNPFLMHKMVRHYYNNEEGLYQNNDYSEKTLLAMCSTVPEEKPYYNATDKAPFDFIKINPVSSKARTAAQKTVREQKEELKENLAAQFESQTVVSRMEKPLQKTSSPSKLEELEHQTILETSPIAKRIEEINAGGANPAYAELNSFFKNPGTASKDEETDFESEDSERELEATSAKSKFTRATFGTMAHSYLEHWVKTGSIENAENPATFDSKVARALSENFDEKSHKKLSEICKTMTANFSQSEIGKLVIAAKSNSRICKAENTFKMMLDGTLFNGSIDLFIENDDKTFTLIDYKTDEQIHPEKYFEQQSCYKDAIEKIYGINVSKCYLYYLRFDKKIEITAEVENTEIKMPSE